MKTVKILFLIIIVAIFCQGCAALATAAIRKKYEDDYYAKYGVQAPPMQPYQSSYSGSVDYVAEQEKKRQEDIQQFQQFQERMRENGAKFQRDMEDRRPKEYTVEPVPYGPEGTYRVTPR